MTITFRVHGTPAPQGSKRHVGNGRMIESSTAVKPWREAVKFAALEELDGAVDCMAGPLAVEVTFYLRKPKAAREGSAPAKRPDLDKLVRSTFDGIGEAGVWRDDALVVEVLAQKRYADETNTPGAFIAVWEC